MKSTRLAKMKLTNLIGKNAKREFETTLRSLLLYDGMTERNGFIKCTSEDVWVIAFRAWYYGINIIGVESDIDEDIPFYDFCVEDHVDDSNILGERNPSYWIIKAVMPIVIKHPNLSLRFYIEVPKPNIPVLEKVVSRKGFEVK